MTGGSHYLCVCIRAILTGIGLKTLYCARGSICYNTLIVVTESGDFSLLLKCYVTYGALLAVGHTCLKTGCSLTCYGLLGVTESCSFIACTSLATSGTGVGGIATVFTVGRGYNRALLMTESQGHVTGVGLVTAGTGVGGIATVQAIGSSYYCIIGMSCNRKLVIGCVITSGAGYVCIPTNLSTGGSLCLKGGLVMTESRHFFCLGIATRGTGKSLGACLLTGGSLGNVFLIAVRKSVYGMSCTVKLIATYGAVNNLVIATCFATGCRGGVFNNESRCLAIGKLCVTNRTVMRLFSRLTVGELFATGSTAVRLFSCLTFGKLFAAGSTVVRAFSRLTLGKLFITNGAVVRAFRCLTLRELFATNVTVVIVVITVSALACYLATVLTYVRVFLLCMCTLCHVTAVVTNVILGIKVGVAYFINFFGISMSRIILTGVGHNTLVGTSGSGCYSALVVMSELCDLFLSEKNRVTYKALLTFGKTLVCTGGILCNKNLNSVRNHRDILGVSFTAGASEGLKTCFCTGGNLGNFLNEIVGVSRTHIRAFDKLIDNLTACKRNHKSTN